MFELNICMVRFLKRVIRMFGMLLLVIVVGVIIFFVLGYNSLSRMAQEVKQCNANIMASVQKRADLANRLMDIARSYGEHEKLTHITVSGSLNENVAATNEALISINACAERFPDLKANTTYRQLMNELRDLEGDIQTRRERYNAACKNYNALRSQIPHVLYASNLGFREAPYFSAENLGVIHDFQTADGELLKSMFKKGMTSVGEFAAQHKEPLKNAFSQAASATASTVRRGLDAVGDLKERYAKGFSTQKDEETGMTHPPMEDEGD